MAIARYLSSLFPSSADDCCTLDEAVRRTGVPPGVIARLAEAMGVGQGGEFFTAEDAAMFGWWGRAIAAGLPEEALLQLIRVYREALGRVAEAEVRLFHFYVHEALRAGGLEGAALHDATDARSTALLPMIEPALRCFHRLGFARAEREDMLLHLDSDRSVVDIPGRLAAGIVFVDLSSFTPLTEAMGDVEAATVLARFAEIVREVTERHGGRSVKQIGDAFMLVFFEAQTVVAAGIDIVARVNEEPSFPAARAGVHWGDVVYREGDYYGGAVNLAARVAASAGRHQVVATAAARERASDVASIEFLPLGSRELKGVLEPQELFEARRAGVLPTRRFRDVVCGMELGPKEISARLAIGGAERVFCSETCLRRFVSAPERYLPS